MSDARTYVLLAAGLATCFASAALAVIPVQAPGDGPFLVIAAPWDGGPSAVVKRAGGQLVGPETAPLAVLATDASADDLKVAGAWFVTSPSALPFLCETETVL